MSQDVDKLVEILESYDLREIDEALGRLRDGVPAPQPEVGDLDPGTELDAGDEGRVHLNQLIGFERIILPENNLLPAHFLTEGAEVQRAVAKVVVSPPGWVGTGSMVSPSLLLTNNHVVRDTTDASNTRVRFNYQLDHLGNDQPVDEFEADPASFFHTNVALDYTIVRLKRKSFFRPLAPAAPASPEGSAELEASVGLQPTLPLGHNVPLFDWSRFFYNAGDRYGHLRMRPTITYATDQRLNVVQHPRGRRKEVAIQANRVTNVFSNVVRYTTDTEPGSSGSPVFSNGWDLVALHHAAGSKDASGDWQDNEGIRIDRIVDDLTSSIGGTAAGQAVLTELGL